MALRIVIVGGLSVGILGWAGATSGANSSHQFFQGAGQEVVAGYYSCDGASYTEGDRSAYVRGYASLFATSNIAEHFYPYFSAVGAVPNDIDAITEMCESNVNDLISQVPSICTLGSLQRDGGEFSNGDSSGESVDLRFDFSCQGTRNEVISVIGGFSRAALLLH